MRIIFDQGTHVPLRKFLDEHDVSTAYELGWSMLKNGDLLDSAEEAGFDILITTDRNLRYQQNLDARRISLVVLMTTSWPRIQRETASVAHLVDESILGSYSEIDFT